jgi:DNA-directed RNA polymerase subunit RPC12/RpoP
VQCSKCGAEVARDAAYCSRCGARQGASPGTGSMEHRREVALAALRSGQEAAGVECPNCGGYRLQTVRKDAEENRFWAVAFIATGVASLVIVVVAGDVGLIVANLSTISLAFLLVGALLYAVARRRRRPSAFECFSCGYRVP